MNILNIAGRLAVRITFACIATCAVIPNASADRANWQMHPDQTPSSDLSQPQGNWVLMETKLSKSNPYDSGYWKHTPSGGNGNAAFTVRGANNEYTRTSASWSEPPARPKAGERFHINLTAKVEALTNRPGAHVVVDAYIDVPGLALGHRTRGAQRLATAEGKQSCEAYTESTQCSVVGTLPAGMSSTDKRSLYVSAYNEGMLVINEYVYAWLPAPPTWKQSNINSQALFNSLSGLVEVAVSDEAAAAGAWGFARLETVLTKDMHIRTGEESGCILVYPDMSTVVIGPETHIVLNAPEERSPWSLVAGKIWKNVKNMLTHGYMEVEMSQAVMGIKGTTLVLEDTGSTSTLKVIEGAVEFKPRKGGVSTLVTGGNMISATARGADAMRRFDVAAENRYWATLTDDIRNGRLRGKPGKLGKGSASVPSLLGTWNWTCCRGKHRDTFTITEHRSDGTIRGIFGAQDGNSTPLQGTFKAGVMQFTRHLDIAGRKETQEWRAQIQIQGDVTQTVDGRWSGFAATADNTDFHARLSTGQSTLGGGAVNLARSKPASQSSTSEWSRPNDAQGAVDGIISGSYAFHTSNQANPWWQVDLGGQASIDEVRIFNRLDCCAERARTLQVMLSDDGRQWRTVYRHGGNLFGGRDGKPLKVALSGASARYVRLQLNEANWFHLDEVEVYGRMGDSASIPGGRDYTGHDSPIATPDSRPGSGYLRIEACVDGSDWISLDNGRLNHHHRAFDQIGTHGGCPVSHRVAGGGFLVDGLPVGLARLPMPVGMAGIGRFEVERGRGQVRMDGANRILIDDDGPGGSDVYIIRLYPSATTTGTPPVAIVPGGRDYTAAPVQGQLIFEVGNIGGVGNGPSKSSKFTLAAPHVVTLIRNYHWNGARGAAPGSIALKAKDGGSYGPWQATGSPGQGGVPNAYWTVYPNVTLPAGTYTVIDSDPATWSHNAESNNRGFVRVEGYPADASQPSASPSTGNSQADSLMKEVDGLLDAVKSLKGLFGK